MTNLISPEIALTIEQGRIYTTSNQIAEHFGKEHRNVMRDIANLECSDSFRSLNFEHTTYQHPQNKQTYSACRITRDGFAFLAMGFTGKRAAEWKEKYIAAFNAMEAALKEAAKPRISPELVMAMAREMVRRDDWAVAQRLYLEKQGKYAERLRICAVMMQSSVDTFNKIVSEMIEDRALHAIGEREWAMEMLAVEKARQLAS